MKTKLTKKHKVSAYVLNKELGYSQEDIANLMKVNQSSVSNAVKEIRYEKEIYDLKAELEEARTELRKTLPSSNPLIIKLN
jgi:predicted transcriptional regulator